MTGCAAGTVRSTGDGERHLLAVPFFPDDTDQCGPSALAGVLSFWGPPVEPASLKEEVYLAQVGGSLSVDLLLAAKRRGFKGNLYSGTPEDLKAHLRAGRPVILFINLGLKAFPVGHYVVVTGYDEARRGFYAHSGLQKDQFMSEKSLRRSWDKTGRSTLLITPNGKEERHAAP